jgi:hypothetical protein
MEDFKEWRNPKVSCGLWLCGALGTGKTILTSTIITHINKLYRNTSQGAAAHYYYSGTANARTKASDMLGKHTSTTRTKTDASPDTLKIWEARNRRGDLTHEALGELLHDIIELNDISQTTIIIDALEEDDEESFSDVMETLELLLN